MTLVVEGPRKQAVQLQSHAKHFKSKVQYLNLMMNSSKLNQVITECQKHQLEKDFFEA